MLSSGTHADFAGLRFRGLLAEGWQFSLVRLLQNAKLPQGAFEFDDRVAESAEGGFYVAEEFVYALGVLPSGHSKIAVGDAFDEVHERFL